MIISPRSIKFNDINKDENAKFAEYDALSSLNEMEQTWKIMMAASEAYADHAIDPSDENKLKMEFAIQTAVNELGRLYKERFALMRIFLKTNDKAFKKEYKRIMAERKANSKGRAA